MSVSAFSFRLSSFASIADSPTSSLGVTVFQLSCLSDQLKYHQSAPPSLSSPTSSEMTLLSHESESTAADEDYISPFESKHFYHGVSDDPPPLFQRSDAKQRPYPIPEGRPQGRHSAIPVKTAHTAKHPILKNKLWKESVAPEIIALLKEETRGVRVSAMLPVRFSESAAAAAEDRGKDSDVEVFDDHIVLWISVHPGTTKKTASAPPTRPSSPSSPSTASTTSPCTGSRGLWSRSLGAGPRDDACHERHEPDSLGPPSPHGHPGRSPRCAGDGGR